MAYTEKTLICRDCGRNFPFTVGEPALFAARGRTHEPSTCPECRVAVKAGQSGPSAGVLSGGYASRGGFGRPLREMHPTVCAQCGKATHIPFLPRGDKPYCCLDCFERRRSSRTARNGR